MRGAFAVHRNKCGSCHLWHHELLYRRGLRSVHELRDFIAPLFAVPCYVSNHASCLPGGRVLHGDLCVLGSNRESDSARL